MSARKVKARPNRPDLHGGDEASQREAIAVDRAGSAATAPLSPGRRWLAFGSLMLGLFTLLSAATSVSTAVPVLQRDLHADLSQAEWLVDSYFITVTVTMTTFGRLGDLFGRKRLFVTGGIIFVLGSIACALARDMSFLIAFRAFSALGPAMMMPATLSLITDLFPPEKRGMPMGLWGSLVGIAIGVGPVIGGLMVSDASWPWVFWINVPLGSAAALLAALLLPAPRSIGRIPPLDLPGIALNAGFIFCLSYALVEGNNHGWGSPLIVGLLAASVALFGLFVGREIATRQPMLDLGLFRRLAFSASILVTVAISFALLGVFFFMPLFLQGPKHDTALQSGLTLLPVSAAMFVAGPLGGYLAGHVRPHYPIMAAMLLFCGGMFWLSHLSLSTTWQSLIPPFIIIGLGLGMASANINTAAMGAVPRAEAGAAAGVIATIRQLGSVLGIAVLGAILQVRQQQYLTSELRHVHTQAGRAQAQLLSFTQALDDALLVCAGVLAAGAVAALMVRRRPGDDELQTEGAVQGATQRAGE